MNNPFEGFSHEGGINIVDIRDRLSLTPKQLGIWAEMARRKVRFHKDEAWKTIKLFGLFNYNHIRHELKMGRLITEGKPENVTVWVVPSQQAYNDFIKPLINEFSLDELTIFAGWDL